MFCCENATGKMLVLKLRSQGYYKKNKKVNEKVNEKAFMYLKGFELDHVSVNGYIFIVSLAEAMKLANKFDNPAKVDN